MIGDPPKLKEVKPLAQKIEPTPFPKEQGKKEIPPQKPENPSEKEFGQKEIPAENQFPKLSLPSSKEIKDKISKISPPKIPLSPKLIALILIPLILLVILLLKPKSSPGSGNIPGTEPTEEITPTDSVEPTQIPEPQDLVLKDQIAYLQDKDLWTISSKGTNPQRLTYSNETYADNTDNLIFMSQGIDSFQWHPQGEKIAVISEEKIWLLTPLEKNRSNLTPNPYNKTYRSIFWSPDGQKMASEYKKTVEDSETNQTITQYGIEIFDQQGKSLYEINYNNHFQEPANNRSLQFVSWLPNNQEIIVVRYGETENSPEKNFWIISLDQESKEKIIDIETTAKNAVEEITADLSSDGVQLIYKEESNIWLLNINTRDRIIIKDSASEISSYHQPLFSPDDSKIISFAYLADKSSQLYAQIYYPASEKTEIFWTGLYGYVQDLTWSPNSTNVVFNLAQTSGSTQTVLWNMTVQNHEQKQISTLSLNPSWNPVE